jgi:LmbE family N-acetylglucosaminyl deacetylase/glycosyltransferase involved in cell wall biosynthesis
MICKKISGLHKKNTDAWPEMKRVPYEAGWIPAKKILVVSPHSDDETISCGGTLCRYAASGARIHILLLTDGAKIPVDGIKGKALASMRVKELKNAMEIMGISPDALIIWEEPDRGLKVNSILLGKMESLVNELSPDLCFIPSPYEHHPDHIAASHLFIRLVPWLPRKMNIAFYESQPLPKVNLLVDITMVVEQKKRALSAFKSQLKQKNYKKRIMGLNAFRALSLPGEADSAEAFRFFSGDEVKKMPLLIMEDEKQSSHLNPVLQNHLVSVIIRTCNRPGAVAQAVQSVLDQTWQGMEIIVVNDGSSIPDLPPSPRVPIRVFTTQECFNRSHAANLGWKHAKGTMISFLDDDDLFSSFHIENLITAMDKEPWCSIVYSGVIAQDDKGRKTKLPCPEFDLSRLLKENLFPIHGALVRKKALEAIGGFDESLDIFEDWDLWIRLALEGYSFSPVKIWTALYRKHSHGTLEKIPFGTKKDLDARWTVLKKHEDAIQKCLTNKGRMGKIRLKLRKLFFKVAKDLLS